MRNYTTKQEKLDALLHNEEKISDKLQHPLMLKISNKE